MTIGIEPNPYDDDAAATEAAGRQDTPYAVRMYTRRDPQGYDWAIWQRQPRPVELAPGRQEGRGGVR